MKPILSGILITLSLLLAEAEGQIAVYQGGFDRVGSSVNFSYYERAFLVADFDEGTGSFLFLDIIANGPNGSRRVYAEAADAVNIFVAVKRDRDGGKTRKLVMRAIADNGTAQAYYLGVGELKTTIEGNQSQLPVEVRAPKTLKGHVLSSDDESDLALPANSGLGSAGAAEFSFHLDETRTRKANRTAQTVADTIAEIITEMEKMGFEAESSDSDSSTDDGTDSDSTDDSTSTDSTSTAG